MVFCLLRPPSLSTQQLKRAATHHKRGADGAIPSAATIFASVVKLLSCSASNGEFAGESPAGCANYDGAWFTGNRRPVRLRSEQPWECNSPRADQFNAHVAQRRGSALKTRPVSVQLRPWASLKYGVQASACYAPESQITRTLSRPCSPMQRHEAQTFASAGATPAAGTNFGM